MDPINVSGTNKEMDVATISRNIYISCDTDNTDSVSVSKLIEFIKPYMTENLSALEELQLALDPDKKDINIPNALFMEVMIKWSQKMAGSSDSEHDFNRTPNHLIVLEDKDLPYTHSTPRASLGDKLLKCKDLLNLSNVSAYSLSTSKLEDTNPVDLTVLEEEVKRLQHQLSKTADELSMTRQQVALLEDQNEVLHADIVRLNKKLTSEQHILEQHQKDKIYIEGLREEIACSKKVAEEYKKKLIASEKDTFYLNELLKNMEKEKCALENKNEMFCKQLKDALKENFEMHTIVESKDQGIAEIKQKYDDLKVQCSKQRDFIDQLENAKEILEHQKCTLENTLKEKSTFNSLGNASLSAGKYQKLISNIQIQSNQSILRQVLVKHSTPMKCLAQNIIGKDESNHVTDISCILPSDDCHVSFGKSLIVSNNTAGCKEGNDSSEEDVAWKVPADKSEEYNDAPCTTNEIESLETELQRIKAFPISYQHSTILYERDEQIIELEEEVDKLKKEIEYFKEESAICAMNLKCQIVKPAEIQQSIISLGNEVDFCKDKIDKLKTKIPMTCNKEVQVDLFSDGDLKKELSEISMEKEQTEKRFEGFREEAKVKEREFNDKVLNLENDLQNYQNLVTMLRNNVSELQNVKRELEHEKSELVVNLRRLETANQSMSKALEDTTSKIKYLSGEIERKEFEVKQCKEVCEKRYAIEFEERTRIFKENLEIELKKKLEKDRSQNQLQSKIVELNKKIQNLEISKNTLQSECESNNRLKDDLHTMQLELAVKQKHNDHLIEEHKKLSESYEQLKIEHAQAVASYHAEVNIAQELNGELSKAKKLYEKSVWQIEQNEKDIQKFVNDVSLLNGQIDNQFKEINGIKVAMEKKNKECNALRDELKKVNAVNSTLEIQLEHMKLENEKFNDIYIKYNNILVQIEAQKNEEKDLEGEISDKDTKLEELRAERGEMVTREELAAVSGVNVGRSKLVKTTSKQGGNVERKTSFSKQQVLIEKLKEKLERLETQLVEERERSNELANKLKLTAPPLHNDVDEKLVLQDLEMKLSDAEHKYETLYTEILAKDSQIDEANEKYKKLLQLGQSENLRTTELMKTEERIMVSSTEVNLFDPFKFTKSDGNSVKKFEKSLSCPSSPNSPSEDVLHTKIVQPNSELHLIQLPTFKFSDFSDQLLEEVGSREGSQGKKFSKSEMETMVTTLAVQFLSNSRDLMERVVHETNKYKLEYVGLMSLWWEISNRLREHRGKPTKAVFVLLEELKLRMGDLLQTTGQVGILLHESRMRKCWNLATNYMTTLRQENEKLQKNGASFENMSRHNACSSESDQFKERTNCKSKLLVAISIGALALISSLCVVLHLHCRLTSSEIQYCPLDGIITRQAIGIPPM
ncbi:myosin-6-like isoform X2 [Cylas formicarius]|uniref:myosin-6-like isoform X2 n=1 Tax=Cylas formicarius TaxID=197179 RepID=UPI0029583E7C|nr:myosin-6-like isoform X2 [Cylas formicarius]